MQQSAHSSAIFLNAIARAQRSFFSGKTAEAFESLLFAALEATTSPGGLIGEVQYTRRGTPFLRTHAMTNTVESVQEFSPGPALDLFNLDSLVGEVLTTGMPVLASSADPEGLLAGLPPGFPPVHSFLGLPLKMTGAPVGMIGLYNRPGYGPEHLRLLEDFAQICGSMIVAHTQQQLKEKTENSLRESEFRLNAIVRSMVEGLITMDAGGTILSANPATEKIFGWSEKDLRGQSIHRLLTGLGNKPLDLTRLLAAGTDEKQVQRREATGTHLDGTRFPVDCSVSQVHAGTEGPLLVALIRDITDRKRQEETLYLLQEKLLVANEKLARQSDTDPLTGVGNRRMFDERFLSELKRAARQGQSLCLFLLDVDFFKNYNDHYGHQRGDECLKAVARATAGSLNREGEFLARIGGEEFAGIMPGTMSGAEEYEERVRGLIETIRRMGIEHASSRAAAVVTASAGAVLLVPGPHSDPRAVFQKADEALYRAKSQGRNRAVFEHDGT